MNDLIYCNNFTFREISFCKDHYTDNRVGTTCHYIGWLKQGEVRLISDEGEIILGAGDVFYIPRDCKYESFWSSDGTVRFDSFAFAHFPDPDGNRYKLQQINCTDKERQLLELLDKNMTVNCLTVGWLFELLGSFLTRMEAEPICRRSEIVGRAMRYMYAHDNYKISDIADRLGISESGLYAAFRHKVDMTPVDMKHRIQTEKAVDMLIATDRSVEEISDLLGFSSASYFRRILREQTGKTPREIRKNSSI